MSEKGYRERYNMLAFACVKGIKATEQTEKGSCLSPVKSIFCCDFREGEPNLPVITATA